MTTEEAVQPERTRRRDFERNREAILVAANECFVELGMKAPISAIAKRAGVGAATVYRHFPSRDDLGKAVFDVRLAEYAAVIEEAQANEDPRAAFRDSIHAIVTLQSRDQSFRELVGGGQEIWASSTELPRFANALFSAFDRARREGVLRGDVENEDVFLLLLATEGIARETSTLSDTALLRIVDIVLDGVCNERSPLDGETLSWFQLIDASKG